MIASQLGRTILSGSSATEDEMRVRPGDPAVDHLLEEAAAKAKREAEGDRRSGGR